MRVVVISFFGGCYFLIGAALAGAQENTSPAAPPKAPVNDEAVAAQLAATPAVGSKIAADSNYCATCHTEAALWDAQNQRLFVAPEILQHDIHLQKGVACSDCHGGNPSTSKVNDAHARENGFRVTLAEIQPACTHCHDGPSKRLSEGLHAHAGKKNEQGIASALTCADCHGASGHGIRATTDPVSPLYLTREVALCGKCHEKGHQSYVTSVHGRGLFEAGLAVSATCSDCHEVHGPFPVKDERSNLHGKNVIQTCGKCHLFIQQRLQASVHSWEEDVAKQAARVALGGTATERPVCTSCHFGHDLVDPKSVTFRETLPGRCGNCHEQLSKEYLMSLHGQLTNLGHAPAAKCSDCHGSHDILPVNNPQSSLFGTNRVVTCSRCHAGANENFAQFDPHADHHDAQRAPVFHYIYLGMEILLYSVFGFFGVHTLLWFVRSLVFRIQHGRPRRPQPGEQALVRFEGFHRAMHVVVIISFLGLALTGLPLKYSEQAWAKRLANALGGFDTTSFWHRVCALMTVSYFAAHLIWLVRKIIECHRSGMPWREILFGPDSPVPNFRDLRDMFGMFRWFIGLAKRPTFERWAYWEKFDYWAVFWGVAIIGTSGLLLWFPEFFCWFLPGQVLNIAKIIHSEEALLATGFIFTIHFFNTHLRGEKFPVDMSMLTGLVSTTEMEEERPQLVSRWRATGQLEKYLAKTPSRTTLILAMLGCFLAVAIGLGLLVGILIAVFS